MEPFKSVTAVAVPIDMENVEANALGLARFVEQPITLRLFQRGGNCVFVQSFQFAHGDFIEALNR